ncbi:hypothetical protein [Acetobacter cibinongensis]|uniref:Uncharacterized protein n=1 Tax=Acetobacter cibinongensis TaxID=146475 RepID=A0A1Z5YW22_9PROT|nr:hypothetical protein [Acetobacter cibinongensis]OUJ03164.1 hypothetical protein HK14_03080 [Acetobacter cibinongensis]
MNKNNWPDPERIGFPLFPERDGIHLINMGAMIGMFWSSTRQHYSRVKDWKRGMSPAGMSDFEYCGPCFTPAQISEMLAAERERCVEALQGVSEEYRKNAQEIGTVTATNSAEEKIEAVDDCWVKIRNMGAAL